jgi:hypothetical protein
MCFNLRMADLRDCSYGFHSHSWAKHKGNLWNVYFVCTAPTAKIPHQTWHHIDIWFHTNLLGKGWFCVDLKVPTSMPNPSLDSKCANSPSNMTVSKNISQEG